MLDSGAPGQPNSSHRYSSRRWIPLREQSLTQPVRCVRIVAHIVAMSLARKCLPRCWPRPLTYGHQLVAVMASPAVPLKMFSGMVTQLGSRYWTMSCHREILVDERAVKPDWPVGCCPTSAVGIFDVGLLLWWPNQQHPRPGQHMTSLLFGEEFSCRIGLLVGRRQCSILALKPMCKESGAKEKVIIIGTWGRFQQGRSRSSQLPHDSMTETRFYHSILIKAMREMRKPLQYYCPGLAALTRSISSWNDKISRQPFRGWGIIHIRSLW